MLCKKTVAMDRKLGRIANYYDDGYGEFCGGGNEEMSREEWEEDGMEPEFGDDGCTGSCGTCGVEGCGSFEEDEIETMINSIKNDQQ